jgi:hypothetical protein
MHTNFIPLDTEIVLCIILVLQGDNEIVGMLHKLAYRHYSTHVHMGDRLLIVFDKGEMCIFICVIYNSKVLLEHTVNEMQFIFLVSNKA